MSAIANIDLKGRFQPIADISGQTTIDVETLEEIWPKKESTVHVKCRDHLPIYIYTLHGEPLFFRHFDRPYFPTLRWLPPADAALPAGAPIAFDAEGKESAVGIGLTKLGTEDMKKVNKGVAVESITYKLG
ncbi:hypothetical protein V8E52_011248 [Russula decolorans]